MRARPMVRPRVALVRLAASAAPFTFGALASAVFASACVDTTHDDEVQALGGEAQGVPPGPDHRPGQPCLVCHGGEGPASAQFSVAGTVYAVFKASPPAVGAVVQIEDISGATFMVTTNAAGNFYIGSGDWQPIYPTQMQVTLGAATSQMLTHVGREGSCATCHQSTIGPASPGPVYAAADMSQLVEDGGTGP